MSPDSGVGAGIDSYYEYLLKAYILLGDDLFLQRFNIVRMHTHSYVYLPRVTWFHSVCIIAFCYGSISNLSSITVFAFQNSVQLISTDVIDIYMIFLERFCSNIFCFKLSKLCWLIFFSSQHYASIMKYISQPPLLLDVHIHKPLLPARTWMDSLLAFFPGLQVKSQAFTLLCDVSVMLKKAHLCCSCLRCWREISVLP